MEYSYSKSLRGKTIYLQDLDEAYKSLPDTNMPWSVRATVEDIFCERQYTVDRREFEEIYPKIKIRDTKNIELKFHRGLSSVVFIWRKNGEINVKSSSNEQPLETLLKSKLEGISKERNYNEIVGLGGSVILLIPIIVISYFILVGSLSSLHKYGSAAIFIPTLIIGFSSGISYAFAIKYLTRKYPINIVRDFSGMYSGRSLKQDSPKIIGGLISLIVIPVIIALLLK